MSACHDLFKTYDEWRDWSVREGEAIRSADWSQVNSCQRAKMELQGRIIQYTQSARNHLTATGGSWSEVEQRLRREVASLIDLENQNGETLAQVRCQALAEEAELDRSSRQLRQVRSYAPVVRSATSAAKGMPAVSPPAMLSKASNPASRITVTHRKSIKTDLMRG
mgnify:CR=1 FL=1